MSTPKKRATSVRTPQEEPITMTVKVMVHHNLSYCLSDSTERLLFALSEINIELRKGDEWARDQDLHKMEGDIRNELYRRFN